MALDLSAVIIRFFHVEIHMRGESYSTSTILGRLVFCQVFVNEHSASLLHGPELKCNECNGRKT